MAASQDLARELKCLQMAKWRHFVECFENKLGQSIESFIETIESVASVMFWGDSEKLICCKLKLKGEAQNVMRAYPHMKISNFKPHKSHTSSFDKFFTCTPKSNETVRDYATRLRLTGCGMVADVPQHEASVLAPIFEENLMAVFLKGLKLSMQRFILSHSHHSFDKALQNAEEEAQNEFMSDGRSYTLAVESREDRSENTIIAATRTTCSETFQKGRDETQKRRRDETGFKGAKSVEIAVVTVIIRTIAIFLSVNFVEKLAIASHSVSPSPVRSISLHSGLFLDVNIQNTRCRLLVDIADRWGTLFQSLGQSVELYTSTGSKLDLLGSFEVDLGISELVCSHECVICENDMVFNADGLLGLDFLCAYGCEIDISNRVLKIGIDSFQLSERSMTGNAGVIIPRAR
ncbi:hypothetical protein PR048_024637 [Dryococelus australis]|uniref:Retrotransposon gag domain-containing protein n=1 Tax=Dryococelus australis TaxID=614101 RepID=A0ABQ9GP72_9NEOP|nr:hypothetical protein PR048_024637 [Dryococelus australis]